MAKTLAEITKGLEETYSGPTYNDVGYTYIPWNEALKVANRVFGIDGYAVDVRDVRLEALPNAKGELAYTYAATVRVTVFPKDGQAFYREGVGANDVTFTKEKRGTDKYGKEYIIPSRAQIDTAIKGAASDATNRALKLFGPAFGLDLYDKDDKANTTDSNGQSVSRPSRQSSSSNSDEPTEKQLEWLVKKNLAADEDDARAKFTRETAKVALDAAFKGKTAAPAKAVAKPAPKQTADVEDLDSFFNE